MGQALAEGAKGDPSPNPHVGAIIVRDGEEVGRGHHAKAGESHAEVGAIAAAGEMAEGATLYVTLTPCNHHGRTGPCTEAVLRAGIKRIVVGATDPAPHVGGAVEHLQQAGVEVREGVLPERSDWLIAPFAKHIQCGLPHVTLKAALTLDGRLATRSGDSRWISCDASRVRAHEMRTWSDAILVGVGTVIADEPRLNVRHVDGRDPMRIVLDRELRTPAAAPLLHDGDGEVIIFHGPTASEARRELLSGLGAQLVEVDELEGNGRLNLTSVLQNLGARDVVKLLVEGGAKVHGSFLNAGLADRAALFLAPRILGDPAALPFADGRAAETMRDAWDLQRVTYEPIGTDILVQGVFASEGGT